jgi:hypothetical protein
MKVIFINIILFHIFFFVRSPVFPFYLQWGDLQPVVWAQTRNKVGILLAGAQPGHYLQWNGNPLLLIGDSVTQGWMECGNNFNQTAYVDALAARGMNLLMIWSYIGTNAKFQKNDSRIGYDAPEIWPWVGSPDQRNFDLTQFNQAYFDRLKNLVGYAGSRGVVVIITVHDGWTKGRFDQHPFNATLGNGPLTGNDQYVELADNANEMPKKFNPSWNRRQRNQYFQERFCHKLISELNSYSNVIYEIFNEGGWYQTGQRYHHEQHFLTFFRARCNNLLMSNSDFIFGDKPHNDSKVNVITFHGNWSGRFRDFERGFKRTPAKPYVLSEPVPGWDGNNVALDAIRRSLWEVAMAGAGWVNQNDPSFGWDPNAAVAEKSPLRDKAYDYAGHCARFFNNSGVNFSDMKPQGELSSTGICLAQTGLEYVVYAPYGGSFTVDLSAVSGILNVEWYNPRTGDFTMRTKTTGGSIVSFTAPDSNDWVLHIGRQN